MKKMFFALTAAVIALAFAAPTFAETNNVNGGKPKVMRHDFTGDVKTLDTATHSITLVNREGVSKTFVMTDKLKVVTKDKPQSDLSDVKVGDKVKVSYTAEADGHLNAFRIGPPDVPKKTDAAKPALAPKPGT